MASVLPPDDVVAIKRNPPFDPVGLADDGFKQRRLAGAVGADDGDDLAGANRDIDVIDGPEFVVENRHVLDGQERTCCCRRHGRIRSRDTLP